MPELYVAGPVIRQSMEWDLSPWVQETYTRLSEIANKNATALSLPNAEPQLERSEAKEFFRAIRKRLAHAKAVITIFAAGDVSAAIETSIASVSGKKILILAEDPAEIPRLLEGLPGVVEILNPIDADGRLDDAVRRLLNAKPPGRNNGRDQVRR